MGCISSGANAGNANNVRNVNTDGNAWNNNNAMNTNGVAVDCEEKCVKVSKSMPKSESLPKESITCFSSENELENSDDVDLPWVSTSKNGDKFARFAHHNRWSDDDEEWLIHDITSFDSLYRASNKCKRGVLWKDSVAGFMRKRLVSLKKLQEDLISGKYKISPYNTFVVHEKKTRLIVSTRFRDRVFQRSMCDDYLYDQMTKGFIYDNCACQVGKGTEFARNRLCCHLQRYWRKHGLNGYILKIDIHDYFGSTPHEVAKAAVRKRVQSDWVYGQVCDIIDSFDQISPDKGMGLGSQVTQLVQLAVLDDIDHYIKEGLRIKHYVRYMDDFVLFHEDKNYLLQCKQEIIKRLAALGLSINTKKTCVQKMGSGIHFLGFSFRITESGKVVKTVLKKNIKKEKTKLKKLVAFTTIGYMDKSKVDQCYQSWKGHVEYGNSHKLILEMDAFYKSLYKNMEVNKYVQIYESKRPDYCASP